MAKLGEDVCRGLEFAKLPQGKWYPTGSPVFPAQSLIFSFQTPLKFSLRLTSFQP